MTLQVYLTIKGASDTDLNALCILKSELLKEVGAHILLIWEGFQKQFLQKCTKSTTMTSITKFPLLPLAMNGWEEKVTTAR